jgi:hypothetical protein
VFVRIEVVDCFIQKPSSIVTSVFFITNRPLYAQIILDECITLLDSIEDHAEADRRTLADLPLEKTVQMSGTASSLYQVTITSEPRSALLRLCRKLRKRTSGPQTDSMLAEPRYGPSLCRWRI